MKFKSKNLEITWKRKTLLDLKIRRKLELIIGDAEIIAYEGNNSFLTNDGRKIVTGGAETVSTIEIRDDK